MSLRPKKVDFHEKWRFLRDCFEKTLAMTDTEGFHSADVRLAVYQLCECPDPHPFCAELYYAIKEMLEEHVKAVAEELLQASQGNEPLLERYLECWDKFVIGTNAIESLVHFLDSTWVKDSVVGCPNPLVVDGLSPLLLEELGEELFGPNESDVKDVFFFAQLCVNLWSDLLFERVAPRLVEETLAWIRRDRIGEEFGQNLVARYRDSVLALAQPAAPLEIYQRWLEEPFIEDMRAFYCVESSNFIIENGILNYLSKCQSRIEEEEIRMTKCIDSSSVCNVVERLNDVLIGQNAEKIYAELRSMFKLEQTEHISRAHWLLLRVPDGLLPLQREWRQYIFAFATKMLQDLLSTARLTSDVGKRSGGKRGEAVGISPVAYVECLVAVYRHLTGLVHSALASSVDFRITLDKACVEILKENCVQAQQKATAHYSAQQLSSYIDTLLRGSKARVMDENEQEVQVEHCIALFKLIEDKDAFKKYYSNKLSLRLIDGASSSEYLEQLVLTSLHNVCGFDYVSKLRKMLQDIKLAEGCNERFRSFIRRNSLLVGDITESEHSHSSLLDNLTVLVLTTASWPLSEPAGNVVLPVNLQACVNTFSRFYDTEHSGRKLLWLHNHSRGDVALLGFKKPYVITMPTYLLSVVLLFNDDVQLSYGAIKVRTNLSDAELQYSLLKLTKCRLLVSVGMNGTPSKTSEGSKLTTSSAFRVNDSFAFKSVRFKIAGRVPQATTAKAVDDRIDHDRHLYLQAAIVRVMKHRKQLSHEHLVLEILSQSTLGFKPSVTAIKRSVEQLIDKEYLERLPDNSSVYRYLA